MSGWSTIESDPGVFTRLSRDIGIRGTQVEEIVTMEDQVMRPHMSGRRRDPQDEEGIPPPGLQRPPASVPSELPGLPAGSEMAPMAACVLAPLPPRVTLQGAAAVESVSMQ